MFIIDPDIQIWMTLFFVVGAIGLYTVEKLPMEYISIALMGVLLLFFQIFPVPGPDGRNLLDAARILEGFANPALIAVLALLVVGQGMVNTRALTHVVQSVFMLGGTQPALTRILALIFVLVISAFLNNTPVVVIFIPIMQALSDRLGASASSVMMPLSFAAILGGMTTLIGSSTNLLVSSSLIELGETPFTFFEFTLPGLFLASVGLIYVLFIAPRILPDRATLANTLMGESGKQFIAQITVLEDSKLVEEENKSSVEFQSRWDVLDDVRRSSSDFLRTFSTE